MSEHEATETAWKDSYWAIVRDCLTDLHGLSRAEAEAHASRLRTAIESGEPSPYRDIFYHADPFDIARDLAGHQLDFEPYRAAYQAIERRHAGEPAWPTESPV